MSKTDSFTHERLTASGDTTELERIRQFVQDKAREFGFSEQNIHKIALAVDGVFQSYPPRLPARRL